MKDVRDTDPRRPREPEGGEESAHRGDEADGAGCGQPSPQASAPAFPPYPPFPAYAPYAPNPPFPPYPPYPPYPSAPPSIAIGAFAPCPAAEEAGRGPGPGGQGEGAGRGPDIDERGPDEGPRGGPGEGQGEGEEVPDSSAGEPDPGQRPDGGGGPEEQPQGERPPLKVSRAAVRRPDDFLVLDLAFEGMAFKENPPRLERAASEAYVVVEFPPQSFGEEAYLQVAPEVSIEPAHKDTIEVTSHPGYPDKNVAGANAAIPGALPAARIRMSGPSRVAVSMPATANTIGFDLASMLSALRDWPMRLDFNAVPDAPTGLLQHELVVPADAGAMLTALVRADTSAASISNAPSGPIDAEIVSVTDLAALRPFLMGPHEPAKNVTALEVPYRLMVSPLAPARWQHRDAPHVRRGRTELWHTRLTIRESGAGADLPSRIRALWSPDYRPKEKFDELIALVSANPDAVPPEEAQPNPDLVRMSLDPVDRSMLVTLMSGFDATRDSDAAYKPVSSEATRLHLSALGALLDAEGTWTKLPSGVDLQQWRHLATLGRDHYVRVMYAGYLCPFGHAASLVKVTERKFQSLVPGSKERVAILRQRFFIVVREPVRSYDGNNHQHHGHDFPLRQVEIVTRVTPDLCEPGMGASQLIPTGPLGVTPRMLFWPMVPANNAAAMTDFGFGVVATDIVGNRMTFAMPLLFVGKLVDASATALAAAKKAYNAASGFAKRRAPLGGAILAYAPFDPDDKGDPRLPTRSVTFRVGDLVSKREPNFHPEIDLAEVGVKPIQKLLSQRDFVVEVAYPDFYATHGLDPTKNAGQVFLKLTKAIPLAFGGSPDQAKSDALGALASPQMHLLGLSKIVGPVGGEPALDAGKVEQNLDEVRDGSFDPLKIFKEARILGGISLGEIIGKKHDLAANDVPKMLTRDYPDRVEASFSWNTEVVGPDKRNLLIVRADPAKPPTRLVMDGVVRTPHDASQPASFQANANLNNFKINLFGFVILWFEQLIFVARNGQKPDVTVELNNEEAVRFGGPLEFVNALRDYIPSNGFSDPPALLVTPSGINASYSLTLPAIEVGVFALSNLSLGAAFSLPFDSRPASVKFNFSERQQPFSLTVSLLGGGGFFAIGVSAEGVNEIEAALEFGAAIAINLGVASGSVEVKAGVYFHWLEAISGQGSVELAGYVRIHGELTVIAIISVSLTFHLQLGYLKEGGKSTVYGEATLVVEIEILMFSASVSVKCRREFAGGEADPKFIDLVPTPSLWKDYCDAFAEELVA